MPRNHEVGPRLETRVKAPFPRPLDEWSALDYRLFALTIVVAAAAMVLATLVPPFLAVNGRDLTACLAALFFGHLTGYNPLSFTQFIDLSRVAPPDIVARWIYLPFLGAICLLFALAGLGGVRVEQTVGRNAVAAASALASLLFLILLLAYPVSRMIYGECFCGNPEQSVLTATAHLRWGYYVALGLSLYVIVANEVLIATVPIRRWVAPNVRRVKSFCVISICPLQDAAGVECCPEISAKFSKAVNKNSITSSTFTLSDGDKHAVSGTVAFPSAYEVRFTPDEDLRPNTDYTVSIDGCVRDWNGTTLDAGFVWSFKTAESPTVEAKSPADSAKNVPVTTLVRVTFSAPMDRSTVSTRTFTVRGPDTLDVPGKVTYDVKRHEATFEPKKDALKKGTTYEAVIVEGSDGVKSEKCFPLPERCAWKFTTIGGKPCPTPPCAKDCGKPKPCKDCRTQASPDAGSETSAEASAQQQNSQLQSSETSQTDTASQQVSQQQVSSPQIHIHIPQTNAPQVSVSQVNTSQVHTPPVEIEVRGSPLDIDIGETKVDVAPLTRLSGKEHGGSETTYPQKTVAQQAGDSSEEPAPPEGDNAHATTDASQIEPGPPTMSGTTESVPEPTTVKQPTHENDATSPKPGSAGPHFGPPIFPPSWPLPEEVPPAASDGARKPDPTDSGLPDVTDGSDENVALSD